MMMVNKSKLTFEMFKDHIYFFSIWIFQVVETTAKGIIKQLPVAVNLNDVMTKYPVLYEQSMNTVLVQEVIR